jgi:hypothetical protein
MSLLSEHIIPDDKGRIFTTNAKNHKALESIKFRILTIDGITNVEVREDVFPCELKVYASKLVKIKAIEDTVAELKFHVIPKHDFKFL